MNQQPFNNPPAQNPAQNPVPPANSPFEMPAQQPQSPTPAPQGAPPQPGYPAGGYQPTNLEPTKGKSSLILIIVLVIILVLGGLVFASWEGWINLGSIQNLWKKSSTTTTTTPASTTTTTTPTNANDQQRKTDLANLKSALVKYYQANQSYPVAATTQKTLDPNNALSILMPTYISQLPLDPLSPTYYYGYQSDGKIFTITAVLEDKTDPLGIQQGTLYLYKVTDTSVETPTASDSTSTSGSTNSSSSSTTTGQ